MSSCWPRPKKKSNRAQNRANILSDFVCFSWFFDVLIGGFQKWRINDSWSIATLFGTVLERPKMRPNLDPRNPYLSPTYFKTIQEKLWGHPWKLFFISENLKLWELWKVGAPNCLKTLEFTMLNIGNEKMTNLTFVKKM